MCKEIGYNLTRLPNQFNHETQDEAGLEVHQFWPLVKIQCSPDLRFFLCSMYTPICLPSYTRPLPACRSLCERAKLGCLPVMQKYGFEWPKRMSCSKLPEYGGTELCMDPQAQDPRGGAGGRRPGTLTHVAPVSTVGPVSGQCNGDLVQLRPGDSLYNTSVSWAELENCAAPCLSPFFTTEDRQFVELWLSVWAILCCLSTATTFTTFLIDPARFHYPERPIMYLSLCYLMVSIGYLVRISAGHELVSCQNQRPGDITSADNKLVSRVAMPGSGTTENSVLCTSVFVLIYFFSMSSSVWWVMLTFTWFLSAGLKWATESISRYSTLYHCLSWFLPVVTTVAALITSSVEGDNVAGLCHIGSSSPKSFLILVLIPLLIYLLLGISFLAAGFISLFKIRNVIKEQGGRAKIDKLEKLMVKIGIFSVLYIVPAGTVIACGFYELFFYKQWESSYLCPGCTTRGHGSYPDFSVLMLKYFMTLAVGITSGFWIWSGKTLDAWKQFLTKCFLFSRQKKPTHVGGNQIVGKTDPLPAIPVSPSAFTPPGTTVGGNLYSTIPMSKQAPLSHL